MRLHNWQRIIWCWIWVSLLALTAKAVPTKHDFHVCITQITHNPKAATLEITVKIFTDDLERTIRTLTGEELRLGDPRESPKADDLMFEYLHNRLQIATDQQARTYKWIGKEVENDVVWCYLEVDNAHKFNTIDITNRILTEIFDDQSNLVHVEVNGATTSMIMDKNKLSGRITL
jgi:hypothetical protein